MASMKATVWIDQLVFPESPRWHQGEFWFSDMYAGTIWAAVPGKSPKLMIDWKNDVSGLGWMPNGDLLFVDMNNRKVMRKGKEGISLHCDLSALASCHCNDMVVDDSGRAYVGNFGFDAIKGESFSKAELILINENGDASIVADKMSFPNGPVLTPDGKMLIVAESMARRLTAFDIEESTGNLTNRREWAKIENGYPDGICMDQAGGIWVAAVKQPSLIRVVQGGKVTDSIETSAQPYACMLGGPEGRTLFIAVTDIDQDTASHESMRANRKGKIEVVEVDVPHAGLP
jgi:sugar lactone lactonase YvrE